MSQTADCLPTAAGLQVSILASDAIQASKTTLLTCPCEAIGARGRFIAVEKVFEP